MEMKYKPFLFEVNSLMDYINKCIEPESYLSNIFEAYSHKNIKFLSI